MHDNDVTFQSHIGNDKYTFIINPDPNQIIDDSAEVYCPTELPSKAPFVVVFGKDRLGEGSDDLGYVLVGGMLTALIETNKKPEKIIFLNFGINLVTDGSLVIPLLKKLEENGTEMLCCGTCLDYFGKIDQLKIGRMTDMAEILDVLIHYPNAINI